MLDTHVYEVLPETLLFRRSGNSSRTFVACRIVRTRAYARKQTDGSMIVSVSLLTTGFENLVFKEWFKDWDALDNLGSGGSADFQGGRPVDVAVETTMFDQLIATGRYIEQHAYQLENERLRPFGLPLVAVRIGDRWVEPELPADRPR